MDLLEYAEAMERRERALSLHEKKESGADFLERARAVAQHLAQKHGSVTVDEVRAVTGPPPEDSDSRIMGSIFKKGWVKIGYETSRRGINNGRPIARFAISERPS